ncbi:glyoxalase/bleomycin resistance/extradiol dioxygenase family protein [Amycolatopsis sp. WAC 01375]|uniref:VOC family protein n=1 Tax=unclassified Amycolatopsis TaxID=2618356 RepID=UPI000F7A0721|nr:MULTISPECIES: VOC family protein [unclassified Amycolatopsis]RSM76544.1 glyoxalase/bleomycin resistance/extradiol dioxygenase family protein [Amycolatopsis sp. WAC 01375]RSN33233.1 glyoxalase/bleomycin resistance/extradiol dioxygenase family protein [Amycolatopsis sp. WAC 01416]
MYEIDFVEFPSGSAADSSRFFEKAFGWTATSYGPTYSDVQSGGVVSFGFQQDTAQQTVAPLVTIRTEDLERARGSVEAAGGVVTVEPFSFPGGRRFHFREPGGAELAVWTPDS